MDNTLFGPSDHCASEWQNPPKRVAVVDFYKQTWTNYPNIELNVHILSCKAVVQFDKNGNREWADWEDGIDKIVLPDK